MHSGVLVIFENQAVYAEALDFVREFSQRIDADITLLVLAGLSFSSSHLLGERRQARKQITAGYRKMRNEFIGYFSRNGLEIDMVLRIGDPGEELLKFLSERSPFQAIVWGSSETLPFSGGRAVHWLQPVSKRLECPLLTVKKRSG